MRLDARVTHLPCLSGTVQIFALNFLHPEQASSMGSPGQLVTLLCSFTLLSTVLMISFLTLRVVLVIQLRGKMGCPFQRTAS